MASVAREVTAYNEQSRQLQQRIDLAREIHEGVVQRLFGVSLALSRDELLDIDSQRAAPPRCRRALTDLRTALKRPLGHTSRPTAVTFAEELEQISALYGEMEIVLEGRTDDVPSNLEALAQSILVEAVRNARKHAHASRVGVSLRNRAGHARAQVRNDGTPSHSDGQGGVGLRLATLEALQHGGVLEYGEWRRRVAGASRGADRPVSLPGVDVRATGDGGP